MYARAKRKRSQAAVLTGKTDDTLACLRGAVNGGAEKEKDLDLPEKGFYLFMILNSWAVHGLQAALRYPLLVEMFFLFKALKTSRFLRRGSRNFEHTSDGSRNV
jgi:hypothetical protein